MGFGSVANSKNLRLASDLCVAEDGAVSVVADMLVGVGLSLVRGFWRCGRREMILASCIDWLVK